MSQFIYISKEGNVVLLDTNDFLFIKNSKLEKEGFYEPQLKTLIRVMDTPEEDVYHYYWIMNFPELVYKKKRK